MTAAGRTPRMRPGLSSADHRPRRPWWPAAESNTAPAGSKFTRTARR